MGDVAGKAEEITRAEVGIGGAVEEDGEVGGVVEEAGGHDRWVGDVDNRWASVTREGQIEEALASHPGRNYELPSGEHLGGSAISHVGIVVRQRCKETAQRGGSLAVQGPRRPGGKVEAATAGSRVTWYIALASRRDAITSRKAGNSCLLLDLAGTHVTWVRLPRRPPTASV